ncbi:uncharacterized protein V1518DRAFT_226707 [Limtongia smithiae]|uniref:uncharacterized protein n=1 Tax=Limtongia smithiae TaxID=1125753 RepID=UPI0034CD97B2
MVAPLSSAFGSCLDGTADTAVAVVARKTLSQKRRHLQHRRRHKRASLLSLSHAWCCRRSGNEECEGRIRIYEKKIVARALYARQQTAWLCVRRQRNLTFLAQQLGSPTVFNVVCHIAPAPQCISIPFPAICSALYHRLPARLLTRPNFSLDVMVLNSTNNLHVSSLVLLTSVSLHLSFVILCRAATPPSSTYFQITTTDWILTSLI